MLLEVVARWQAMAPAMRTATGVRLVGGICLFPTVVDIAKSPTGRMAAVSLRA